MASSTGFVQYVIDQLSETGTIICRKMFGEYGLYRNGLFFALICDDQLFIKKTSAVKCIFPDIAEAPPYKGASPYFLIDNIDDMDFLYQLTIITCDNLPSPKIKNMKK